MTLTVDKGIEPVENYDIEHPFACQEFPLADEAVLYFLRAYFGGLTAMRPLRSPTMTMRSGPTAIG